MNTQISVIIPTYNRQNLIRRAVDSALRQCLPGDEVIVVDSGSTDQTADVLRAYNTQIRYICLSKSGAGAARNEGISAAKNNILAFLDSDDEWMPGKLELQRRFFAARPDVLFCFSDFATTDRAGNVRRRHLWTWHQDSRPWDEILAAGCNYSAIAPLPDGVADFRVHIGNLSVPEMVSNYVLTSSFAVRRDLAGDALRFAEDLPTFEDLECFGRLSLKGLAAYFDCETTWQHGEDAHRLSEAQMLDRLSARLRILERVWGKDARFLEKHGRLFEQTLNDARRLKARELVALGQVREAREEIRKMKVRPISLSMLAHLPRIVVLGLLTLRRFVKRLFKRTH